MAAVDIHSDLLCMIALYCQNTSMKGYSAPIHQSQLAMSCNHYGAWTVCAGGDAAHPGAAVPRSATPHAAATRPGPPGPAGAPLPGRRPSGGLRRRRHLR